MTCVVSLSLITIKELIKLCCVFVDTGFSINKCLIYLRQSRRKYLFRRYCLELWQQEHHLDSTSKLKTKTMNQSIESIAKDKYFNYATIAIHIEGEESAFDEDEVDFETTFYESIDPFLVYRNTEIGDVHEGVSYTISGFILEHCERFSLDFLLNTPKKDIAIHINPRLPQNFIVRNCRINNIWGTEEITSALPFILERGSNFTIEVLVTRTEYLISVNGRHFAAFRHRLPYNLVKCLEIKGDVEKITYSRKVVNNYPNRLPEAEPKKILIVEVNKGDFCKTFVRYTDRSLLEEEQKKYNEDYINKGLQLPYYGTLPINFDNGQCLRFKGRVKTLPHSFYINLQSGKDIWPHPIISFHLNPRFANLNGKHIICRNSWFNGEWDKEERSEIETDFSPGKPFTLCILSLQDSYEVCLNNKIIVTYKHRNKPDKVDTVYVQGDIKLWDVELDKKIEEVEDIT